MLAVQELRDLISCDPETGKLFWRVRDVKYFKNSKYKPSRSQATWNTRWAGKEAISSINIHGYRTGSVIGHYVSAARVMWAMCNGEWPKQQIDHINGIRSDNRLANLRDVSPAENARNQSMHSNNSSGINGISWSKPNKKWLARITINKKLVQIGLFDNLEEAGEARKRAQIDAGYHPNHGREA